MPALGAPRSCCKLAWGVARMDAATTSAKLRRRKWQLRLPERLPDLKGKWLTLYTIAWAIVLPLSVIGATRGAYIILTTPTM